MYRKADRGWLKHWDFTLIDAICLQAAYVAAYWLRHGFGWPYVNQLYCNMAFVFVLIQIFVTFFGESFKNVLKRGYYREFSSAVKHVCLVILIGAFYLFATQKGENYSRLTLVLTGVIYLAFTYAARIGWKRWLKARGVGARGRRSLLILTSRTMVDTVVQNILANNYEGFQVVGVALIDDDKNNEKTYRGVAVVANGETVAEYVCREWVDEILVNLPEEIPLPQKLLNDFIEMGVTVHLKLVEVAKLSGKKHHVERIGTYTVLTSSINMASWKQAFLKRAMDIAGGVVGCLITGLLYLVVAPCIYIKSPGPIFFSQVRVGKNGKKFKLYKFRSMYMDAEKRKKELMEQNRVKGGMMFKIDNDPRIIGGEKGIGGIIRKYSIDEFPQFWNVLKGDMSLIGTRPPTLDEFEQYETFYKRRLSIRPGITGMWQATGRSDITDFEEVLALDLEYIDNWSLGLDMKILLKTVFGVFGGKGAK